MSEALLSHYLFVTVRCNVNTFASRGCERVLKMLLVDAAVLFSNLPCLFFLELVYSQCKSTFKKSVTCVFKILKEIYPFICFFLLIFL